MKSLTSIPPFLPFPFSLFPNRYSPVASRKSLLRYVTISLFANLLFLSSPPTANAQKNYLNTGAGWSWFKMRDKGMSERLYRGSTVLAHLGYERDGRKALTKLNLFFRYGQLKPGKNYSNRQSTVTLLKPDFNLYYLRPLGYLTDYHVETFLGAAWQTYGTYKEHSRFTNNSINHEFASSLAITGLFRKRFALFQHPLEVNYQLSLPVLSYTIRPSYASSLPQGFLGQYDNYVGAYFSSGELQTIPGYFRANSQIFVNYVLMNQNEIRLTYSWDLYQHASAHQVIAADHGIYLTTSFRF